MFLRFVIIASQLKNNPSGMGVHAFNFLSVLDQNYKELLGRGSTVFAIIPEDIELKFNNLTLVPLPIGKETNKIKRLYNLLIGITKAIKKLQPDVIISLDGKNYNINHPNFYPIIHDTCVFDENNKRYFGTLRTMYWKYEFMRSMKLAKKIYVPTNHVKENIKKLNIKEDKIVVVGDVYPDFLDKKAYDSFKYKHKGHFLFLGHVSYRKNVHTILKAYYLDDENILPPLVIIGEIDKKYKEFHKEMEKLHNKQRENKIIIKGYVSELEKLNLINQAYALIFPSFCEGFGIPVIEAAKFGVISIVPQNSPMFEVLEGRCVTINNREDPEELYIILKNIIYDKFSLNNSKELKKIASKEWTYEHVKNVLKNIEI